MASTVNRITGFSGIDTESMINQIMDAESEKYKNMPRKQKWTTWKQEAYREVATSIDDFKSKFLQSGSNSIRFSSAFNNYQNTVTLNGAESSAIKINSSKSTESFSIKVNSLAQADSCKGTPITASKLSVSGNAGLADSIKNGTDLKFTASLDGVAKEITVTSGDLSESEDNLQDVLNNKLADAFGQTSGGGSKVSVSINGDDSASFVLGEKGSTFSLSSAQQLGVNGTQTNKITTSTKLSDISDDIAGETIKINNKSITIGNDFTVADLQRELKGAGIELKYSSATSAFTLSSTATGTSNAIDFGENSQGVFNKLGIDTSEDSPKHTKASDLKIEIDGIATTRTSNTFDVGDMNITVNNFAEIGKEYEVKAVDDTDKTFENIKSFIDAYNTLITDINGRTTETRKKSDSYSFYEPMTDEEEASLDEKQVEKWNKAAKTGLLYRDDTLNTMLSRFRDIMYTSVKTSDGSSLSLYEIGITTSSDYTKGGYLEIDEDKLKESIAKYGDKIEEMFTKSKEGIGDRLYSAVNDVTGTNGSLRQKAGIKGTVSEFENSLTKELKEISKRLSDEQTRLYNKENYYYKLFASMESAVTSSTSQMNILQSML
ncbi:MAG: flagellar filament capping protein FliD [Firmicutes bacterium]|nr:flagellar filament capping protein FliD [Bacillota bacterium]